MSDDPKTLVSTDWLAAHLNDPDLRIFDASWYLPEMGRDARAEYDAATFPARAFSISTRSAMPRSDLPHMAPPPKNSCQPDARNGRRRRASGGGL